MTTITTSKTEKGIFASGKLPRNAKKLTKRDCKSAMTLILYIKLIDSISAFVLRNAMIMNHAQNHT
jgi:hypothetical protein